MNTATRKSFAIRSFVRNGYRSGQARQLEGRPAHRHNPGGTDLRGSTERLPRLPPAIDPAAHDDALELDAQDGWRGHVRGTPRADMRRPG
jgi:hypothetical protein